MKNKPTMNIKDLDKQIEEILMCMYNSGDTNNCLADIKDLLSQSNREIVKEEKTLNFWKEDIKGCFIPKCSHCGKIATVQTTRGKYAEENNHRPVNWGYYCKKCYEERLKEEQEAMYGE